MEERFDVRFSESMEEEDEELELGNNHNYEDKANGGFLTAFDFINDALPATQESRTHQMATVQVIKNPPRNQSNDSLFSLNSTKNKGNVKNQYINRIQELTKDEKLREHLEKNEEGSLKYQADLQAISPSKQQNTSELNFNNQNEVPNPSRIRHVSSSRELLMKRVGSTELSLAEMQDEKTFKSRESARASRQRKKLYTELLEKKVEQLEIDNAALTKKLQESTSRNQQYNSVVFLFILSLEHSIQKLSFGRIDSGHPVPNGAARG